ncbi:LysR family transcriptional regulator [Kutzneria albida]|uniref:HTH lysR-type domain-containing protein n=1 Tax=Kutzneria albida DSM 43870 TaxID=1449976 RepID=W5W9F7_9PSEU|nr:LysR family transcriptional regulator [Kutzneria albida]AHH97748.1 hypothetical protein KALB_4386 [Kutzneria albida DSM 43870]
MLDPRRLLVLDAVVRAGSMTAAAQELGFSPAAVSQAIAALERQAGTRLLRRHARGVRPTAAGELIAGHAAVVADRVQRAGEDLTALARAEAGTVRIGSFSSATASILPAAARALGRAHPGLRLHVADQDAEQAVESVRRGERDLVLVAALFGAASLDLTGLAVTELGEEVVRLCLPVGHRLHGPGPVALDEAAAEPWILNEDAVCAATLARIATDGSARPRVSMRTRDHASTLGLVAAGLGVALVPGLLRPRDGDGVVVRELHPCPRHPVLLLAGEEDSPTVTAVAKALTEAGRAALGR